MSGPTTKVKVIHRRTHEGWRSEAPGLKAFQREGPTLDAVRQLAEDGVRWALNTERVEIEHEVREETELRAESHQAEESGASTTRAAENEEGQDGRGGDAIEGTQADTRLSRESAEVER